MLEDEIFKKCIIEPSKLLAYGFHKEKDKYKYETEIQNHDFQVIITIIGNKVTCKVIEKELGEEYTNYRVEQSGTFANSIRDEVIQILEAIKKQCTYESNFIFPQANRLSNWIKERWGDNPEYLWEEDDKDAVFRNSLNKKWYGIIMYINKNKLGKENKQVEVMNVKLPSEEIKELVEREGYYPAYHMNKKYWISFVLDDTIPDEELKKWIETSYEYTMEEKEWIVPANPNMWDIVHCFDKTEEIHWKQINSIQENDTIYIYVGKPYSCILYRCKVIQKDIPSPYPEFQTVMRIKMMERYKEEDWPFEKLKECDLKAIRGPRRITKKLREAIAGNQRRKEELR